MAHSMPVHDEALFMAAMTENIQIAATYKNERVKLGLLGALKLAKAMLLLTLAY